MATKKICDRCGAEINPFYSGTRLVLSTGAKDEADCDLCVSCVFHLKRWLDGKEGADNG